MPNTELKRARGCASMCVAAVVPLLAVGCYSGLELERDAGKAGGQPETGSETEPEGGGDTDSGGPDAQPPALCNGEPGVSPRPMLRLTPLEYENTMRDLLGDPGFTAEYDELEPVITERAVRQIRNGAEEAMARRDQWTTSVYACDLAGPEDPGCVDAFLDDFVPKAFRRPLRETERQWLRGVYDEARTTMDFEASMSVLTQTVLQAPSFVYLHLEGRAVDGVAEEIRLLDDYEVANRLSYFLWDTMPDEALFDAAAAGTLTTKDGLAEQVDRMLDDPRTEAKVREFVWRWLQLDGGTLHFSLEESAKDPELFPEYDPALQDAMRAEVEALVSDAFVSGSFDDLLTSRRAYVNRTLADVYGVEGGPVDDDDWQWVELDPVQRSGLLTRAAFLSVYAGPNVHSPIRRGVSVLKDVLCFDIPPPPPNVNDVPPEGSDGTQDEAMTVREEVIAQTSEGECAGCHNLINPAGFAFEHYDAIGRWQDTELLSGLAIDSSGVISASDVDGPVDDAVDMSLRLSQSDQVKECFADYWFAGALGGELGELDECERKRVLETFAETGDMRTLVKDVVLSDTFRFINTSEVEE